MGCYFNFNLEKLISGSSVHHSSHVGIGMGVGDPMYDRPGYHPYGHGYGKTINQSPFPFASFSRGLRQSVETLPSHEHGKCVVVSQEKSFA